MEPPIHVGFLFLFYATKLPSFFLTTDKTIKKIEGFIKGGKGMDYYSSTIGDIDDIITPGRVGRGSHAG